MSTDRSEESPESDVNGKTFRDTELTLGLPGEARPPTVIEGKTCSKRGYSYTVDLNLGSTDVGEPRGKTHVSEKSETNVSGAVKPQAAKAQVVGWPPVRSLRKKALESCTYVKVAVDGAPYLRKVDLQTYTSYQQLLKALEEMFTCFTICRNISLDQESKLMDPVNGTEYVPTYEDRDGDWMLVGDVPWNMFIESCKRIRLMKRSEAKGLAPSTPQKCTSTS